MSLGQAAVCVEFRGMEFLSFVAESITSALLHPLDLTFQKLTFLPVHDFPAYFVHQISNKQHLELGFNIRSRYNFLRKIKLLRFKKYS